MYKPKKEENNPVVSNRQRLPVTAAMPGLKAIQAQFDAAVHRRGLIVEQPWTTSVPKQQFVLMVQWDASAEFPLWTLYEENANESKMHWSQTFPPSDVQLMYDVLSMSVESQAGQSSFKIPDELKPKDDFDLAKPEPIEAKPAPAPAPLPPPPPPPAPAPAPAPAPVQPPPQPYPPQGGYPQPPQGYPQSAPGYPAPQGYPPAYPQPGYPQPMPGYPPAGYPQYPPPQPAYPAQAPAQAPQPAPRQDSIWQSGYAPPASQPSQSFGGSGSKSTSDDLRPIDYNMMDKRANVLLGTLLVEAGLVTTPTLNAALKIQELVRDEKMDQEQAFDALKRLHSMGAAIDNYLSPTDFKSGKVNKPKPAQTSSGGSVTAPGASAPRPGAVDPEKQREMMASFDLLQKAGLLNEADLKSAQAVRSKHGGDMVQILKSAGKLEMKTYEAALTCIRLIHVGKMKVEQCIIALNYCSRSRVGFDEAMEELNWPNPKKS